MGATPATSSTWRCVGPAVVREARAHSSFPPSIPEDACHWPLPPQSTAPVSALPRSVSSTRSESQMRSTSTTLSCSLPSCSPSTTPSPGPVSSTVQVGHLAGGTSGHGVILVTQDHPLNRHVGCRSRRCPGGREGPDNGEAVGPGSGDRAQPQGEPVRQTGSHRQCTITEVSTKGWGKILQVLLDPTQSRILEPLTYAHIHTCAPRCKPPAHTSVPALALCYCLLGTVSAPAKPTVPGSRWEPSYNLGGSARDRKEPAFI